MSLTFFIHLPMKMEPIRSSETSAIKTQTPGNYPKRNILQYSESYCDPVKIKDLPRSDNIFFWRIIPGVLEARIAFKVRFTLSQNVHYLHLWFCTGVLIYP